jgi:SAM-dependent methyltransferase
MTGPDKITHHPKHSPLIGASMSAPSSQMLSAWTDDHLTPHQLDWISAEHDFLCGLIQTADSIFDVGCGDARILHKLAKLPFRSYMGIDIDRASIERADETFSDSRCTFVAGNALSHLPTLIKGWKSRDEGQDGREIVICTGNTLGSLESNQETALRVMMEEADCVIVSVCKNTPEIMLKRLEYYAKNNLSCRVEEWRSGSIISDMWGESRSFDEDSLRLLVRAAGLERPEFSCAISPVGSMGIALIANRKPTI